MQQYLVNGNIEIDNHFEFDKEQSHHIKDVLRMKENTIVRLVNQNCEAGFASVHYQNQQVVGVINQLDTNVNEMKCKVTLCVGLIKKEKWDYLLQKCTELGVSRIVPFESARTVVKSKDEKVSKKLERWNKIVQEAFEQCKRNEIPTIVEPISIKELKNYKSDCNCVAYEDATYSGEKLRDLIKEQCSITIVIGPEGGFSQTEIDSLVSDGFHCISLGKRILRAETAATYALSAIDAIIE